MKQLFLMLMFALFIFPLQAAVVHIDTRGNTAHIIVHEGRNFPQGPVDYRGVEPQSGHRFDHPRKVIYYYPPYASPVDRSERLFNNSGTGAHGPGTY